MGTVSASMELSKGFFRFGKTAFKEAPSEAKVLAGSSLLSLPMSSNIFETAINVGGIATIFCPMLLPFMAAASGIKGIYHICKGIGALGSADKGEALGHFMNGALSLAFALPLTSTLKNLNALKTSASTTVQLSGKQLEKYTIGKVLGAEKEAIKTMGANLDRLKKGMKAEQEIVTGFTKKLTATERELERTIRIATAQKQNNKLQFAPKPKNGITPDLLKQAETRLTKAATNAETILARETKALEKATKAAQEAAEAATKDAQNTALKATAEAMKASETAAKASVEAATKQSKLVAKRLKGFKKLSEERTQLQSDIEIANKRVEMWKVHHDKAKDAIIQVKSETFDEAKVLKQYNSTLNKVTIDPAKFTDELVQRAYGADGDAFRRVVTQPLMRDGAKSTVASAGNGVVKVTRRGFEVVAKAWSDAGKQTAKQATNSLATSNIILKPGESLTKGGIIVPEELARELTKAA